MHRFPCCRAGMAAGQGESFGAAGPCAQSSAFPWTGNGEKDRNAHFTGMAVEISALAEANFSGRPSSPPRPPLPADRIVLRGYPRQFEAVNRLTKKGNAMSFLLR